MNKKQNNFKIIINFKLKVDCLIKKKSKKKRDNNNKNFLRLKVLKRNR